MIYGKKILTDGLYHFIKVMLNLSLSNRLFIFKINGTVVSFHQVFNRDFLFTEFWFTDKYHPPANATISNFEIWGADLIQNVEREFPMTQSTTTLTTTTTTTSFVALLEEKPSFQLPGIYNSTSPAWRDFIIMFEEIGPEFRWGLKQF